MPGMNSHEGPRSSRPFKVAGVELEIFIIHACLIGAGRDPDQRQAGTGQSPGAWPGGAHMSIGHVLKSSWDQRRERWDGPRQMPHNFFNPNHTRKPLSSSCGLSVSVQFTLCAMIAGMMRESFCGSLTGLSCAVLPFTCLWWTYSCCRTWPSSVLKVLRLLNTQNICTLPMGSPYLAHLIHNLQGFSRFWVRCRYRTAHQSCGQTQA